MWTTVKIILRWSVSNILELLVSRLLCTVTDSVQNLGLGVLEEKRGDQEDSSGDEGDDEMGGTGSDKKGKDGEDADILGKLMGGKNADTDKPAIEDLGH